MDWLNENWVYIALVVVGYVVGRIHGKSSAQAEMLYMSQAQAQQDMFNSYINNLKSGN